MYPILAAKGIPYGVSPYASLNYCVDTLQRGGICVYRPGAPDCPSTLFEGDARASARNFMQYAAGAALILKGSERVWIEPLNECFQTPLSVDQLMWLSEWMDEYIERAHELGWPPLALPTMGPGAGDLLFFAKLKSVFLKLKEYGGLYSIHIYTFHSQTDLCVYDEWEAARHVLTHTQMELLDYSIPITITEAARQFGNAPVSEKDFICWVNKVLAEGFVHSVFLWVGGYNATWPNANLDGHYVAIAHGVGG